LAVTLFDLVKTLETVLERVRNRPLYEVDPEDVSVPDMILYLKSRLKDSARGAGVSVTEMFERQRSRRAMVCLFLAILEMVKQQAIVLAQPEPFGDIVVKRHIHFDQVQITSEELAKIEEEYSN
jgi:segregation and condensation protein A